MKGKNMKIVFFDVENYEKNVLSEHNNYILEPNSLNDYSDIPKEYIDADIISIFTSSRINKTVLKKFPNLKLIALRSVGYNHVDIDYCKKNDIKVVNSPNYGNISVAEFAFTLLLDVCRKVTLSYNNFKEGKVCPNEFIGMELSNKTIWIVGLGSIGSALAKITLGFDMKILAFDKVENELIKEKLNIKYVDFETLLENSDFISIHAPLSKHNYHMFNEKSFEKMKSSAILINTGRGELIDSKALYKALLNHEIAGAGLDVLEKEEAITDYDYIMGINRLDKVALEQTIINNQLFKLNNVIITPHIAYNTYEAINKIINITIKNIDEFMVKYQKSKCFSLANQVFC